MRPSRLFGVLHKSASARIHRLRRLAQIACIRPSGEFANANREVSWVAIELQNAISNFARAFFLSCTINPLTEGGTRVTCTVTVSSFIDAIDAAMKACKFSMWRNARGRKTWDRRDEPPWHQPATLIDSSREIGCSNYGSILAAFALPTTVFDHLPKFRNFYAHRNDSTSGNAQSLALHYSISPNQHPSRILCAPAYGRPQALILDWIDDTLNVIDLLCQ
jgi:hypothetical protein